MELADQLRIQAHANRLANHRLHAAMAALSREAFHAPRTSFFPSLAATLNHLLAVDEYYVGALCRDGGLAAKYQAFVPADDLPALAARQAASDDRLIAFARRSTTAAATRSSTWTAGARCSATVPAMCWRTCSCTRPITAARPMRCWPAPPSHRLSSTSS